MKRFLIIAVAVFLFLCGCIKSGENKETGSISNLTNEASPKFDSKHGSAAFIKEKTVIVSIFANDKNTFWDFENNHDILQINGTLENLTTSTEWLKKQIYDYKVNTDFIFDWKQNDDLIYKTTFDKDMINHTDYLYETEKKFIDCNLDSEELLNKYNAKNIIFVFFFNTDFKNTVNPSSYTSSSGQKYNAELINIPIRFDAKFITSPAIYAHEIMHCFGAHDLYYKNHYIPQEYVDYCIENNINDIMFTVDTNNDIKSDFSQLDAYYLGLVNNCEDVDKWNLAKSMYIAD